LVGKTAIHSIVLIVFSDQELGDRMPLSKPSPRKLMHNRTIICHGYEREDGMWDIEATLTDTKTYTFDNVDRGGITAGEPIHHMLIRLTVNDELTIQQAEAASDAHPFTICGDVTADFDALKGLTIGPGWRRQVLNLFGRVKGCTHLTDLLVGPLAVATFQTVIPARKVRNSGSSGSRPQLIDTCHAFRGDGPIVKREWPEFYQGD